MSDCGKAKGCATCAHDTPIGANVPAECRGCIVQGECTKWERPE